MTALMAMGLAILTTAAGQLSFKYYAMKRTRTWLFVALALFCSIPLFTFVAVRGLGLGTVYVSTGLTYVLVALCGRFFFAERIGITHALALGLILCGCLLYGYQA